MISKLYDEIFTTETGEKIYSEAERAIQDFSMLDLIKRGVLVGFSGGSDSLMLLLFLREFKKRRKLNFKLLAVHINHSIRGNEADSDERLAQDIASELGVEFICERVNVPELSKEKSIGLEEAARKARYSVFSDIISARTDVGAIATAHNAGDNFETLLFNMMRGTGLLGMCGITPRRDNIIRPLIYITKTDIEALLLDKKIKFAVDSTNFSTDYTRNYIRHELIPKFKRLSDNPEKAIKRLCENLRSDSSFIESAADEFFGANYRDSHIQSSLLRDLHPALLKRVIDRMIRSHGADASLESLHYAEISHMLVSGRDFRYSLPTRLAFVCERDISFITADRVEKKEFFQELNLGINEIDDFSDKILISYEKPDISSSNVYKISIQVRLYFDIINRTLYVRSKKDGDAYKYGGITHKLKKLFNDLKLPLSQRCDVPVFTDGDGILWVPGFSVRDAEKCGEQIYITILSECEKQNNKRKFYIPRKFNI